MNTQTVKLVFSFFALIFAFAFTFFFAGSGIEPYVVTIFTVLGGYFGIDWRRMYDDLKEWYKSKTIVGALMIVIPTIVWFVVTIFNLPLPSWILDLIVYVIGAGGLSFIIGVFRAISKNKNAQDTL